MTDFQSEQESVLEAVEDIFCFLVFCLFVFVHVFLMFVFVCLSFFFVFADGCGRPGLDGRPPRELGPLRGEMREVAAVSHAAAAPTHREERHTLQRATRRFPTTRPSSPTQVTRSSSNSSRSPPPADGGPVW